MSANELADELVDWYEDYNGRFDLIDEAIAMLRQQQLRIDQLLEAQDYLFKKRDEQQTEITALKFILTGDQLYELHRKTMATWDDMIRKAQ
jgi:hypothetical protein